MMLSVLVSVYEDAGGEVPGDARVNLGRAPVMSKHSAAGQR